MGSSWAPRPCPAAGSSAARLPIFHSPPAHATAHAGLRGIGSDPPASASADRKSTRLNSSHLVISYAVFCLKKKKKKYKLIIHLAMPDTRASSGHRRHGGCDRTN